MFGAMHRLLQLVHLDLCLINLSEWLCCVSDDDDDIHRGEMVIRKKELKLRGERGVCRGLAIYLQLNTWFQGGGEWQTIHSLDKDFCFTFLSQRQLPLDPVPTCVNCTAFNHNGTLCITGGADGMIRLFGNWIDCMVTNVSPFSHTRRSYYSKT